MHYYYYYLFSRCRVSYLKGNWLFINILSLFIDFWEGRGGGIKGDQVKSREFG